MKSARGEGQQKYGSAGTAGRTAGEQFGLPTPVQALASIAARAASAVQLTRQGKDYEHGLAQLVAAEYPDARFSPNWTGSTSPSTTLAYAIYRFNLQGYAAYQTLHLAWATPPADYSQLWIGFSRWDPGRWEWFPGPGNGVVAVDAPGFTPYARPDTADMLVAVVMLGTTPGALHELKIASIENWSMFGREPMHSRRSPYYGASAAVVWSYTTGGPVSSSPAIGADGTVYVGSNDYKLHAVNPDGSLQWAYLTGGEVLSSPAIGADGMVYVGSNDYSLYALKPDGAIKWSYVTRGPVRSSPAIGADGTVYVGNDDGKLYAFGQ